MQQPDFIPRLRALNLKSIQPNGRYVLYWMTANRRAGWNHALDRAMEHCKALNKPLLVMEGLRIGYPWASDRMHRFVMDGMLDNGRAFADAGVRYFAYVERKAGEGKGLLQHLAEDACVVIADEWPHFFLPKMANSAASQTGVAMESVDSIGLWPVHGNGSGFVKPFGRAYDFRRFLQKNLAPELERTPKAKPFARMTKRPLVRLPKGTRERWPEATPDWLRRPESLSVLAIDHSVPPSGLRGGSLEGGRIVSGFVSKRVKAYNEKRTELDMASTSGLSPYLHFGHVSSHQILNQIAKLEGWNTQALQHGTTKPTGTRLGWWKMSEASETFLDQLVTWRELGFHRSAIDPKFGRYEGLPEWARNSLQEHAADKRPYTYRLAQFEAGETHDELWNAAQNQLVHEGTIHNYLRMLWGKKILHWTRSPKKAFEIMVHLNNKYALDGRDPNSYSGIGWVLGLFDRAWGPEREVFGKIRYMSSDNTRRKLRVKSYVKRHADQGEQGQLF